MSPLPQKGVSSSVTETDILKSNLSKVSEAPKKTVLEKKLLVAVPKKEMVPPAEGIWGFPLFLNNACLFKP